MTRAAGSLRGQLDLLRRRESFRSLFLASLASGLGTWIAVIALTIDVFDRTHSAKWVSALLIADFLPAVAIGLLFSPLIDRVSRRGLMIAADLGRFAIFVGLVFADSPGAIVGLAGAAGFATGFFRPAAYAGLPNLVERTDLPSANALLRAIETVTITLGTLLGGVIVAASGPDLAYSLNAATFLISAGFIAQIPGRLLLAERAETRGHWRDVVEGFAAVKRSRALLTVFVVWNLVLLPAGATNVAEVALAKVSFSAGDLGFALLWTLTGVGQGFGSLFAAHWLARRGLSFVYPAAVALMAFGAATAGVSPTVWVALCCVALAGAGNGAAHVYNALLVQWGAPDRLRGRVFTVLMSSTLAMMGIGMIVGGPLTDAVGARWVYVGAGAFAALGAAVAYALVRAVPAGVAAEEAPPAPVSVPS